MGHIFSTWCSTCQHTVQYDKREICSDNGYVVYRQTVRSDDGKQLDTIILKCNFRHSDGSVCGAENTVEGVNCEDYR